MSNEYEGITDQNSAEMRLVVDREPLSADRTRVIFLEDKLRDIVSCLEHETRQCGAWSPTEVARIKEQIEFLLASSEKPPPFDPRAIEQNTATKAKLDTLMAGRGKPDEQREFDRRMGFDTDAAT